MNPEQKPINSPITLPGAIIIAAAIIAIALIYLKAPVPAKVAEQPIAQNSRTINLSPIIASDHIFGNPNAPIRIVEFSDPSCPYCKLFNPNMEDVMATYGESGNVAWVYRHFPLNQIHPNAEKQAEALECVASLGGNAKFWAYEKAWYEDIGLDDGPNRSATDDQKAVLKVAKSVGVDTVALNDCLASDRFKDLVAKHLLDGENAGVNGTPTSFMVLNKPANEKIIDKINQLIQANRMSNDNLYITDDRKIIGLGGALPASVIKDLIDYVFAIVPTTK